jgi:hypothetical protein
MSHLLRGADPAGRVAAVRRWKVPGFCRAVERLDTLTHTRLGWLPLWVHDLMCAIYDWSLGLTWREARS